MAGSIKGITIEVGGNTTELSKALGNVNGETRSLQSELKQVDKLLKLDPENIALCEQKEQLLTEAIEATSSKLDILKEAQEQVQEQFEAGEVSEEQYRALERQIAATEIQLQSYQGELQTVQSTDSEVQNTTNDMGEAFEDAGKKADDMGDAGKDSADSIAEAFAAAGITALIDGIIGKMQEMVNVYSESAAAIVEGTGATGENLDDLKDSLDNVFSKVTDSNTTMQDTANVLAEVNTRTGLTGEALEDLTLNVMEFAEHTGTDGVAAIDGLMDVTKKWGLTTEDNTHLMDLLTVANQSCSLSVDEMLGYLTDNQVQFEQLGYSVEDATALMVSLSDSGVDVSSVMSGMKKAITNLAETTDDVPGTFNNMISSISKCGSVTEALGMEVGNTGKSVSDVFGAKAAQEMINAIQSGNFALEDWQTTLGACEGALQTTADTANTTEDQWQQAQNNIAIAASKIFEPALEGVSSAFAGIITKMAQVAQDSPVLQAVIIALATALGILAGALAISSIITMVTKAMSLLNLSFLACPVTWIVIAIAALAAAFVTLWNKCDAFRNFWIGLWEKVKVAFQAVCDYLQPHIEAIKKWFSDCVDGIKLAWDFVQPYIQIIWGVIQKVMADVAQIFRDTWEIIKIVWDWVQPYFQNLWVAIKTIFTVVSEVLGGYFKSAWELIKTVWDVAVMYFSTIWENIKIVFSAVGEVLGAYFRTAWEIIKAVWNVVVAYFAAIWNAIKNIFSVVKNVLTGNFSEAWEGIKNIFSGFANFFETAWNSVKTIFSAVGNFFATVFSTAWEAVKGVFSNWGSFFTGLWDRIKTTFSNLGTIISNAIGNAIKAGINGVITMIENRINSAIGLINGAIGLINKIPGVAVKKITPLSLPRLARGGVLEEGQAMVAEDGAELLSMVNGKAVVTPLTSTSAKKNISEVTGQGKGNTFTQNVNITSSKELSPAETARQTRNATRQMILAIQRG